MEDEGTRFFSVRTLIKRNDGGNTILRRSSAKIDFLGRIVIFIDGIELRLEKEQEIFEYKIPLAKSAERTKKYRKRKDLPDPSKPASADVNRGLAHVSMAMPISMVEAIDCVAERFDINRNKWIGGLVGAFIGANLNREPASFQTDEETQIVNLRIDFSLAARVDDEAKKYSLSRSEWVRRVVNEALDHDRHHIHIAPPADKQSALLP